MPPQPPSQHTHHYQCNFLIFIFTNPITNKSTSGSKWTCLAAGSSAGSALSPFSSAARVCIRWNNSATNQLCQRFDDWMSS